MPGQATVGAFCLKQRGVVSALIRASSEQEQRRHNWPTDIECVGGSGLGTPPLPEYEVIDDDLPHDDDLWQSAPVAVGIGDVAEILFTSVHKQQPEIRHGGRWH